MKIILSDWFKPKKKPEYEGYGSVNFRSIARVWFFVAFLIFLCWVFIRLGYWWVAIALIILIIFLVWIFEKKGHKKKGWKMKTNLKGKTYIRWG